MHQAFNHLAKRVTGAQEGLLEVIRELQRQNERETQTLEQAAYGDDFDEELAPIQEKVVAALQQAIDLLDQAEQNMTQAREALEDIPNL